VSHFLFWDIDGTLLSTARAGVFALEQAHTDVLGTEPDFSKLNTAGLTDHLIAEMILRESGREVTPEAASDILRAYERALPERLHWRKGQVLEGVFEILDDVAQRPGVHSLLLTGNTPTGAQTKLEHYDLARYFEDGAFCADGDDRMTIARRAWELAAARAGDDLDPDRVFVIGDTPHDVSSAKAIGARSVAVATGGATLSDLEACEPWLLLETLPEPAEFASLLGLPETGA
jgi:phosphoglycolate phosphatase